ncbi:MAG: MFS transporter [Rhodobacteraceae bacterium]|nr:MFS transporter [Paracoccaceae bacterium]
MILILSFSSLLLSVVLLQLGSGALGPFDVISGLALGFSDRQLGLLGSAHFIGFITGCWWGPRLIGSVGHSRAFACFAAIGTIGILLHMMIVDPWVWALLRTLSGLSIAGCFTVIEAWMQAKVSNQNRGRALGIYRTVDLAAGGLAQLLITFLMPAHFIAYNILAIICCASLLPLIVTRLPPPVTPQHLRLQPLLALKISPMATSGVLVAGVTAAGFRMVGPLYGDRIGLDISEVAIFLAFYTLGGGLAQYPAGWLADKIDRRQVLIILSFASLLTCVMTMFAPLDRIWIIYLCSTLFGFASFPIYSVAAAHANDHSTIEKMVELSASLLFYFSIGAILSPFLLALLIDRFGPASMFFGIGLVYLTLAGIGGIRMIIGREKHHITPYVYTPRTSYFIGRLLRFKRRPRDD